MQKRPISRNFSLATLSISCVQMYFVSMCPEQMRTTPRAQKFLRAGHVCEPLLDVNIGTTLRTREALRFHALLMTISVCRRSQVGSAATQHSSSNCVRRTHNMTVLAE
eukprot:4715899-Pleurochrysis_carterae.AAC.2